VAKGGSYEGAGKAFVLGGVEPEGQGLQLKERFYLELINFW